MTLRAVSSARRSKASLSKSCFIYVHGELILALALGGCAAPMNIRQDDWGRADDTPVRLYTLDNGRGLTARVADYGATLVELHVPDRAGRPADVVLGYDSLEPYLARHPYFGSTVGRVANRIAGARFALDGKEYRLAANNGPHHLHGGLRGFDRKVWTARPLPRPDGPALELTLVSPDGEEGYPGTLRARVVYALTRDDELIVQMDATSDAPTIVNLANHTYWNLAGQGSGDVLGHELTIHAARYTPTDATLIPTGAAAPVAGTPFDFTRAAKVGTHIAFFKSPEQLARGHGGGYDVNFVVDGTPGELRPAAQLRDPTSGRTMDLWTDAPGVQLYTANGFDGSQRGKRGAAYVRHAGLCLETQVYPDAIHRPEWPSPILRPGQTYRHVMVHKFSAR
jgi:aldose 1-epimerase